MSLCFTGAAAGLIFCEETLVFNTIVGGTPPPPVGGPGLCSQGWWQQLKTIKLVPTSAPEPEKCSACLLLIPLPNTPSPLPLHMEESCSQEWLVSYREKILMLGKAGTDIS